MNKEFILVHEKTGEVFHVLRRGGWEWKDHPYIVYDTNGERSKAKIVSLPKTFKTLKGGCRFRDRC